MEVCSKFKSAFELFAACHCIYDKSAVTDAEIKELSKLTINKITLVIGRQILAGQNVKKFLAFYRANFPYSTVFLKLHVLEFHVVPWMERWMVGLGLMGVQGAESIHRYFNSLEQTYRSIPDQASRLHLMMKEHYLHMAPVHIAQYPPVKKRKIAT